MNLKFTCTVTEHNITIPIRNDSMVEVTEQFIVYLTLQSSNSAIAITPARAIVNVRNDNGCRNDNRNDKFSPYEWRYISLSDH